MPEFTVYNRKSPKQQSATLHANSELDALKAVIAAYKWHAKDLNVCTFATWEDYMTGQIRRYQLNLESVKFAYQF